MLSLIASLSTQFTKCVLIATPSLSIPWAIIILAILIGLAITFSPSGRRHEIKRPKDE
ncbi:MAG: hypothetical protein WD738_17790 [Pirellulales bacterium]